MQNVRGYKMSEVKELTVYDFVNMTKVGTGEYLGYRDWLLSSLDMKILTTYMKQVRPNWLNETTQTSSIKISTAFHISARFFIDNNGKQDFTTINVEPELTRQSLCPTNVTPYRAKRSQSKLRSQSSSQQIRDEIYIKCMTQQWNAVIEVKKLFFIPNKRHQWNAVIEFEVKEYFSFPKGTTMECCD